MFRMYVFVFVGHDLIDHAITLVEECTYYLPRIPETPVAQLKSPCVGADTSVVSLGGEPISERWTSKNRTFATRVNRKISQHRICLLW